MNTVVCYAGPAGACRVVVAGADPAARARITRALDPDGCFLPTAVGLPEAGPIGPGRYRLEALADTPVPPSVPVTLVTLAERFSAAKHDPDDLAERLAFETL